VTAKQVLHDVLTYHHRKSGEYILSGTDGKKRLSGWTKGHARMMRAIRAITGEHPTRIWTPHDLRRTVATRIAEQLGIGGEQLIKRVLGHRYGYVKEMRIVLEKWVAELTAIDSVVLKTSATAELSSVEGSRISRFSEAA